jgi:hypothetical protein
MKKYIVITKDNYGHTYCAVEGKKHHKLAEKERILEGYTRLHQSRLDDECDLAYYPNKIYFVFEPK